MMDVKRRKRAVGARTILDDRRLAERRTELVRDDPTDRIAGAAGPEYRDHCDRARRIILCVKRGAETDGRGGGENEKQFSHCCFLPPMQSRAIFF